MPAIKAYTFASESNTADAGITLTPPSNSTGDLLLALVVADSFSGGVWNAPSGWTLAAPYNVSFHTTNNVDSVNDYITVNGHKFTTAEPVLYSKYGGSASIGLTANTTVYYVRSVDANTISLHSTSSGATANTGKINLTASGPETHYLTSATFGFAYNATHLAAFWKISSGNETTPVAFGSGSGIAETYTGCMLSIEDVNQTTPISSTGASTANAANGSFAAPSVTTTADNSLCIVALALGSATRGLLVDDVLEHLGQRTGSAESLAVGWFVKGSFGATPTPAVSATGNASGSVCGVFAVAPPSTGATKIPPHASSDTSVLLNPLDGSSSYNGNSSLAQTADTGFSTTLGSYTAADGTVSSVSSGGLDPDFSSTAINIGVTPVNDVYYGSEITAATTFDFSNKNLLAHIGVTGGYAVATTDTFIPGGVLLGCRSSSGSNYKVWTILGSDTPGLARTKLRPVVIDPSTENTFASNGTLSGDAVTAVGAWYTTNASAATSTHWLVLSLWEIGVTTICGGVAEFPITIFDIAEIISSKYRETVTLLGGSLALVYQPLIIGNGGSNATYLNMNACAIEFPEQANAAKAIGDFRVADNWVGIQYYPGSSDTIKHTNSVISSNSRYHWGLHPSASSSASYDFGGLTVVGAGSITLNKNIDIDGLTVVDYDTISLTAELTNCSISIAPSGSDSLTINAGGSLAKCTLDVSGVAAGNRWTSVASPSIFSDCTFIGDGGHALRLTTPGTYSFDGNTFAGFGSDGTDGAAILNDSGGAITLNITGGGGTPTVKNGTGATTTVQNAVSIFLTNVVTGSSYYVFETDSPENIYGYGIASGSTVEISTAYLEDTNITARVRNASGVTKYKPFSTQADLNASGASVYVSQEIDGVA